jgi:uncharacterized membrane-anchored protein
MGECRLAQMEVRRQPDLRLQTLIAMLETIAVLLVILWLLGFLTSYTLGGFIHILLVIAVVVIIIRVIQGRSAL